MRLGPLSLDEEAKKWGKTYRMGDMNGEG